MDRRGQTAADDPQVRQAPGYLRQLRGVQDPNALRSAELLTFTMNIGKPLPLQFAKGDQKVTFQPGKSMVSNDIEAVMEAAAQSMGVAFLPTFLVSGVTATDLAPVLPDWNIEGPPVHVVYPTARHLSRRVRALVDFAVRHRAW
jgi:LysR family transcriptional regulator, regulator for bpeEF and oprC